MNIEIHSKQSDILEVIADLSNDEVFTAVTFPSSKSTDRKTRPNGGVCIHISDRLPLPPGCARSRCRKLVGGTM